MDSGQYCDSYIISSEMIFPDDIDVECCSCYQAGFAELVPFLVM
jgi:hypothetical protein